MVTVTLIVKKFNVRVPPTLFRVGVHIDDDDDDDDDDDHDDDDDDDNKKRMLLLLGNDWSPSRSGPKPHHGRWMKPDASTNDEEQRTLLYAGRKDAIFVCQRTSRCSGREVGRLF
ncbi:hypothetical protein HZH68_003665 [Vespula germanica]|uniref:Uncharacterized protein n=1 Tax=Vespula germanica TaxID=30212 RepID=A0A834NPH8_VESGE|nr:hypothetical protein HZH68_003665 [Vespula germanica]